MKILFMFVFLVILFSGCSSDKLKKIENDLLIANSRIEQLEIERDNALLEGEKLKKTKKSLENEKKFHKEETYIVRDEVRYFVKEQLAILNEFANNTSFFNYYGCEPISRSFIEGQNMLIIDIDHAFKSNGTIIGGKIFPKEPGNLIFCIVSPNDYGYEIVWMSNSVDFAADKVFHYEFETPLEISPGDFPAVYFKSNVAIPYDTEKGNVVIFEGDIFINQKISYNDVKNKKRTYSFGLTGL